MTSARLVGALVVLLGLAACAPPARVVPAAPLTRPGDLVDASDPQPISEIAWRYGEASWGRDSLGDPVIDARFGELPYRIEFYGCDRGQACRSLRLFRAFDEVDGEPVLSKAKIASWNAGRRFGKASRDENGRVVIEMNLLLAGGVARQNLDALFDTWGSVLTEFSARAEG